MCVRWDSWGRGRSFLGDVFLLSVRSADFRRNYPVAAYGSWKIGWSKLWARLASVAAFEHVDLQPYLVPGAAKGAVSPSIAVGDGRVHHLACLAPIAIGGRCDGRIADKAEAPVDAELICDL